MIRQVLRRIRFSDAEMKDFNRIELVIFISTGGNASDITTNERHSLIAKEKVKKFYPDVNCDEK